MKSFKVWKKISSALNALKIKVIKLRLAFVLAMSKFLRLLNYSCISVVGALVAGVLLSPPMQNKLSLLINLDSIFIASGGLIGTMIVLTLTLSIIPIQRAVECFSPSITRIFRDDRIIQGIILILSLFCLLSFLMNYGVIVGLQFQSLIPVQLFLIAISLDLLRWFHRRVTNLLEPSKAIRLLLEKIKNYIDLIQNQISTMAKIQWESSSDEEKKKYKQHHYETRLYLSLPDVQGTLNYWSGELAEIAHKAITKKETHTSQIAINAMAEFACYYLECRKDNITLIPKDLLVIGSDVDKILSAVCQNLQDVNRSAISTLSETVSIDVIETLGRITSYTTTLRAAAFRKGTTPLSWLPFGYLKSCIEEAQSKGLDDAVLNGSKIYLEITKSAPDNVDPADIHMHAIKGWCKIAGSFTIKSNWVLANEVLKDMLTLGDWLLEKEHYQIEFILRDIFNQLENLIPIGVALEKTHGSTITNTPLSPPYDTTFDMSIAHLVNKATAKIKTEEGKDWINPYNHFIELNEVFFQHIRTIAEKTDLGSSSLLWHIGKTIKIISKAFLALLEKPLTKNEGFIKELVDKFSWYLPFFWVAFSKMTSIALYISKEDCDINAWIGISFYEKGFKDITELCASNIASITDSYCKVNKSINFFDVADLLMPIRYLKLLALKKGDKVFAAKLKKKLEKPKSLPEEQWEEVQKVFPIRLAQLEEDFDRYDNNRFKLDDSARGLLIRLLRKK